MALLVAAAEDMVLDVDGVMETGENAVVKVEEVAEATSGSGVVSEEGDNLLLLSNASSTRRRCLSGSDSSSIV